MEQGSPLWLTLWNPQWSSPPALSVWNFTRLLNRCRRRRHCTANHSSGAAANALRVKGLRRAGAGLVAFSCRSLWLVGPISFLEHQYDGEYHTVWSFRYLLSILPKYTTTYWNAVGFEPPTLNHWTTYFTSLNKWKQITKFVISL